MITTLVDMARNKANALNLQTLAPLCDGESCPGNRARWHGLLRRSDGLRFEGRWYCGADCFRDAFEYRIRRLSAGELFGRVLLRLGFASEDQIVAAIASQWGSPVYPVERSSECQHMIPQLLQEQHLMTPIHWVPATRDLYVAFTRAVNHSLLYSIESMLECHTIPCFIKDSSLTERLRNAASTTPESEISIETRATAQEMCGSVVSYAQQVGAEEVRLLACDTHFWIRIQTDHRHFDLLFRRS
jgi:hypothetical protein